MCCRDIIAGLQQLLQISEKDRSLMVSERYPAVGLSPFDIPLPNSRHHIVVETLPEFKTLSCLLGSGGRTFWTLVGFFFHSEGQGSNLSVSAEDGHAVLYG